MSPKEVCLAILMLGVLLIIGKSLRVRVRWIQKLFLPSAIVAGFIGLLLGPQVFGKIAAHFGATQFKAGGLFSENIIHVWQSLPGLLISLVFATMFLGQKLPGPKKVVELAGPQLSVGIGFASGQYMIGLLLTVLLILPFFPEIPATIACIIEIGFEGGHGTAGGMIPVFKEIGFSEGGDLSVGSATVGLIGGVVAGVAAINWAVRTGKTKIVKERANQSLEEQSGLFRRDEQYVGAHLTSRPSSIEPLSLHIGILAISILVGQLILSGLQLIEAHLWADKVELLKYVPLFPMAMIGGMIVQIVLNKIGYDHLIDEQMMLRIQGLGLDFLITAALASMSLTAIASHLVPFLILCLGGFLINFFILLWLCPRTFPEYWFERGIGDFGQASGVTATGLILMRIVDPEGDSPCFVAFGYKQLVFEPFFGGGLITAVAVPVVHQFGPYPLLIIMAALFVFSIVSGVFYWGRHKADANKPLSDVHGTVYPPQD